MRAQRQTNPNVLKISIIAHKEEWEELINIITDAISEEECNIAEAWQTILTKVVLEGRPNWNERTEIETGEVER